MKTATKKRTARSASTRSTPQESIEPHLRERIADLERVVDSLHDLAQRHLDQGQAYLRRAEAAEAVVRMREGRIAMMTDLIIKAKMEIARKEGYIDRVRENDASVSVTGVRNPAPGEIVDFTDVREAMAQADEAGFDRIISSLSQESLDRVMGRTGHEQSDLLR